MKIDWNKRIRGPIREIVFEEIDGRKITEILACGHKHPLTQDKSKDSYWSVGFRHCQICLEELRDGIRTSEFLDMVWSVDGWKPYNYPVRPRKTKTAKVMAPETPEENKI